MNKDFHTERAVREGCTRAEAKMRNLIDWVNGKFGPVPNQDDVPPWL